jgi:hypothetical protein
MKLSRKSRLIGGAVTILVLGVVGLVYAAWTTSGSGSGYAKAGTSQALTTLDVSVSTIADLYPGTNGNVLVRVNNPNPYPVRVTDINGNGAITAGGGIGTCTTTGVTYTNQTGTFDIPANSAATFTLNNAAHMTNASENGCQGATFTIPVSLTGASNAA